MGSPIAKAAWIAAVVIVAAAGWFFASPLFIDKVVDEAFEFPARAEVDRMSASERQTAMDRSTEAAAAMPDKVMDEPMGLLETPAVIARGSFRDADAVHRGAGAATLYRLADDRHLLRLENFRVTNGPKLVVYLAVHPDPQSAADVLEGFVSLGELKGNVGSQNYAVPDGIDVSGYRSTVIWCELFDVLFSSAPLAISPVDSAGA